MNWQLVVGRLEAARKIYEDATEEACETCDSQRQARSRKGG